MLGHTTVYSNVLASSSLSDPRWSITVRVADVRFAELVESKLVSQPALLQRWGIDAIQCDRAQPMCNNYIRGRQVCPGYGDVFDGAHRSQTQVVRRRIARLNATSSVEYSHGGKRIPSCAGSSDLVPTKSQVMTVTSKSKPSPQPKVCSTVRSQPSWTCEETGSPAAQALRVAIDNDFDNFSPSIPRALTQALQDPSVCFFFRHYGGTAFDPEARNGFNQLWRPIICRHSLGPPCG